MFGNKDLAKSLAHEVTPEESEDSDWEEFDEAIANDEKPEDNQSGDSAGSNDMDFFQRVKPNSTPRRSELAISLMMYDGNRTSAPVLSRDETRKQMILREFSKSLGRDVLQERRVQNSTINAFKRRQRSQKKALETQVLGESEESCSNQSYHQRGW